MAQDAVTSEPPSAPLTGKVKPVAAPRMAPPSRIDLRGPVSALMLACAFLVLAALSEPAVPGSALPWLLNPTGYLSGGWYLVLYVLVIIAKEIMNRALEFALSNLLGVKKMDEGEGKVKKLEVLETIDLCYLACNTLVEYLGMNHIVATLLHGPVDQRLGTFGILNGPLAVMVALFINDIIYYPFHVVAHRRAFYPYVHKQHHRNFVPFRGYPDAANQHPFEQTYGFSIFIASLHITARVVGLHAGAAWCAFLAWALLNMCNHFAFDLQTHLPLPYPAYPRDHQMHHRFPQCNYSTLTTFCDRIFGTFRSYKPLGQPIVTEEKPLRHEAGAMGQEKKAALSKRMGRPEAVPSPWSVAGLAVGLVVAATAVETCHAGRLPAPADFTQFLWSSVVLVSMALVCKATEGARTV